MGFKHNNYRLGRGSAGKPQESQAPAPTNGADGAGIDKPNLFAALDSTILGPSSNANEATKTIARIAIAEAIGVLK